MDWCWPHGQDVSSSAGLGPFIRSSKAEKGRKGEKQGKHRADPLGKCSVDSLLGLLSRS